VISQQIREMREKGSNTKGGEEDEGRRRKKKK
jgi:hypothetical protein